MRSLSLLLILVVFPVGMYPPVAAADYYLSGADTQLAWGTMTPSDSVQYGHGRVNAFDAILSISRGDVNNDGIIDIGGDLGALIDWIFFAIEPFPTHLLTDCNCDGTTDGSDLQYFLDWGWFGTGPAPVKPCFKF